ncbi:MAG: hypothetical protein C0504_04110 [Candidatus Solibacter sp.]|nr:hypothetical protein [Candidatus Solibacter sp.]
MAHPRVPAIRDGQQCGDLADGFVKAGVHAHAHVSSMAGRRRGQWAWTREKTAAGGRNVWLLDAMSSTHNESRLAACPLSGVPERVRAPVN